MSVMASMGGAFLVSTARADEPMEAYAAGKHAEPEPAVPHAAPAAGINLYPMHSTWPKAPYPVEPRSSKNYGYPEQAGYPPHRGYRGPSGYGRKSTYPSYPKAYKQERYAEPPSYPHKPDYSERGGYSGQSGYSKPYGAVEKDAYPAERDYPRTSGYRSPPKHPGNEPYADLPRHQGSAPYAGPDEYPKRALGVSIAHGKPDPEIPLAPDYELNRHRGFGRLFPVLDPQDPSGRGLPAQGSRLAELRALGKILREPGHPEDPAGDSDIPAGYTYLGQFIDHDLTLDLSTSLAKGIRGDEVANTRTPELDLDNLYAGGPIATPYIYKLPYLRTGRLIEGEGAYVRHDLLRADEDYRPGPPGGKATAVIGDPRDDENVIVSQLHAAFVAFHNRTVDLLVKRGYGRQRYKYCRSNVCSIYRLADALPPHVKFEIFETARDHVLHYYHRVIADDFLPRIIGRDRVEDIFTRGRDFFFAHGLREKDGRLRSAYIPVEFAAAAYRFGHSQVRSFYQLREGRRVSLFGSQGGGGLQAFQPVTRHHLIDWRYFFDIDKAPPPAFNYARRLDPLVSAALHQINLNNVVGRRDLGALPARNLVRGRVFYLPSGQTVAEQILPALEARGALGGPYARGPRSKDGYRGGAWQAFLLPPDERTRGFLGPEETPLWYYVLQEAEVFGISRQVSYTGAYTAQYQGGSHHDGAQWQRASYDGGPKGRGFGYGEGGNSLGPVGGTIVGEVLIGLLEHFKEKTGKGLGYHPNIRGSISFVPEGYAKAGPRPRYLMRNLLLDAGVVDIY